jgi:uncharacterized membrane protein YphA (DoxX/SURF4 family)
MRRPKVSRTFFLETGEDSKMIFIRIIVGLVFISEGLQKFSILTAVGPAFFRDLGFHYPVFWAYFTGFFELTCGILIMAGFFTRLASIPLLIIMVVAFVTTKLPLLATKGFVAFVHEYRIDFLLTVLLLLLLIYGGGKWSLDLNRSVRKKEKSTM